MPCILLTRPRDGSEALAKNLTARGYQSIIEPLLFITPCSSPQPEIENIQAVMATSRHAFDFLDPAIAQTSGLFGRPLFCVGTATADTARRFGFRSVYDAAGDGLTLAKDMVATLNPKGGAILHIAARDVDSKAREVLEDSDFNVRTWTLYAAETATEMSPETQMAFRESSLDAVLVFSARTARTLVDLVQKHGLVDACKNMVALGISTAVCHELDELPWRLFAAAPDPTEEAVLQRLQELLPV